MAKVLYEKRNRIGYITLNCPEALNALDDELREVWNDLAMPDVTFCCRKLCDRGTGRGHAPRKASLTGLLPVFAHASSPRAIGCDAGWLCESATIICTSWILATTGLDMTNG